MQQVEALACRRCGPAVVSIRNRPDEQVDDMLVVLENQSADDAVMNVIEPTADQRKALRRRVDYRRRGIKLAVEPRFDRVLICRRDVGKVPRLERTNVRVDDLRCRHW